MRPIACLAILGFAACSSQVSSTTDDLSVAAGDDLGLADDLSASTSDDLLVAAPPDLDCTDDEARCASSACAAGTCLVTSNVAGAGALLRTSGLAPVTVDAVDGGLPDSGLPDGNLPQAVLDTATGAIGGLRAANPDPAVFAVVDQIGFVRRLQGASEPPLAIWVFGGVTLQGGRIAVVGDGAAVLVSATDLTVASTALVDVAARGTARGAGGFPGGYILVPDPHYGTNGLGCGGGLGSEVTSGGAGGGAGFGSNGGSNGTSDGGGLAANCEGYGSLVPLVGGSGGGGGSTSTSTTGPSILFGGGGGGALQLSALGTLTVDGRLSAGGGGARVPQGNSREGSGGGAGGGLLLEAPAIVIGATAGLFANGGAGGSQSPGTGMPACTKPAQDALLSSTAATGGTCSPNNASVGGNGAAGASGATSGTFNGGGGGGFGRVVLRKRTATAPSIHAGAQLSPPATHPAFRTVGP